MQRKLILPLMAAAALAAVAFAAGPVLALALAPLGLLAAVLPMLSASAGNPMPRRRLPHWLDVALYRAVTLGVRLRNGLGAALFSWQVRSGAVMCMAFPGSVTNGLAFGVVGELAFDGPCRTQPARINHGTAADIVIGRWFTLAADGTARPGGTGALGGLFVFPKNYASLGTSGGGTLAPTLTVPSGTIGEFGYMGVFVVACTTANNIGDAAWYDTTTGAIGAGAPGAGQAAIPNSRFIRTANAAAGLAYLELTN